MENNTDNRPGGGQPPKRLYRSRTNAPIGGVCAGLAEYFNVDVSLVRVIAAVTLLFTCSVTFWVYILMWIIIPLAPEQGSGNTDTQP